MQEIREAVLRAKRRQSHRMAKRRGRVDTMRRTALNELALRRASDPLRPLATPYVWLPDAIAVARPRTDAARAALAPVRQRALQAKRRIEAAVAAADSDAQAAADREYAKVMKRLRPLKNQFKECKRIEVAGDTLQERYKVRTRWSVLGAVRAALPDAS